jgi:hypothetical protein
MTGSRSPIAEYLRFLAWAVAIGIALVLLGYPATRRLGGEGAIPAMIAGCAIGILASAFGALPVFTSRRSGARDALQGMLLSMALRLAAVVVLGLAAGLSGWFEIRPLLIWIAFGYVATLPLDVRYAVRGL